MLDLSFFSSFARDLPLESPGGKDLTVESRGSIPQKRLWGACGWGPSSMLEADHGMFRLCGVQTHRVRKRGRRGTGLLSQGFLLPWRLLWRGLADLHPFESKHFGETLCLETFYFTCGTCKKNKNKPQMMQMQQNAWWAFRDLILLLKG